MNSLQLNKGRTTPPDPAGNSRLIEATGRSSYSFYRCKTPPAADDHTASGSQPGQGNDVLVLPQDGPAAVAISEPRLIENEKLSLFLEQAKQRLSLSGHVKKRDNGRYFVKDEETLIWLPLLRSVWETEEAGFYEELLHTKVAYRIVASEGALGASACLLHRQLSPAYYTLLGRLYAKAPVKAMVTGEEPGFYVLALPSIGVPARIHKDAGNCSLAPGDMIQVLVVKLDETGVLLEPLET